MTIGEVLSAKGVHMVANVRTMPVVPMGDYIDDYVVKVCPICTQKFSTRRQSIHATCPDCVSKFGM